MTNTNRSINFETPDYPRICEEFIEHAESPEFCYLMDIENAFCRKQAKPLKFAFPYAFVTYLDSNPKKLLHFTLCKDTHHPPQYNLCDLLESEKPGNFYDLLYIITLYDPLGFFSHACRKAPFPRPIMGSNPLLDPILQISGGNLIYHHQIETLYRQLTDCNEEDAKKFSRAICREMVWAWAESELLIFADGKSLSQVLNKRMLFKQSFNADYRGATYLFEWYNRIAEENDK